MLVYSNGTFVNNAFSSKDTISYALGTLTVLNFSIKTLVLFAVYADALNGDKCLARRFTSQ